MFPFWDIAIEPVLNAVDPRRVVEIGALRGETTTRLLDALAADAELHVIDPLPEFDPAEQERRFDGRYVFHRGLSLDVLPELGAVDVALIDGDHNWYSVYNELKLLADSARSAGQPLPVMLMHDVGWPYGRRDLYYAPEQIPESDRQPHARRGMRRGQSKLAARGGLNPTLDNALEEGGPRNGVLTALEDFIAQHDRSVRTVIIPVYFGLAIVAEEWRLAREPRLASHMDWLESVDGQRAVVALADELHSDAVTAQHNAVFGRRAEHEQMIGMYLDLLGAALRDEHYVENELRVHYLSVCTRKGRTPDMAVLRDPARAMPAEMARLRAARRSGRLPGDGNDRHPYFPYTTMGAARLAHLRKCLDAVRLERVPGDLVECGTAAGGAGVFLRGYLAAYGIADRSLWVADTFRASPPDGAGPDQRPEPSSHPVLHPVLADINAVRDGFARFELLDERVKFLQGPPATTLGRAPIEQVALLRMGDTLDGSPEDILDELYPKLSVGGFVIVEDCTTNDRGAAVDAYRKRAGIDEPVERIDAAGVCWRKLREPAEHEIDGAIATWARRDVPARAAAKRPHKDLSVVVVVFDMRREAERTLHSLSRAYQEGIDDLDYEVIVVENGSAPSEALGEQFVRAYGPEFHYLPTGDNATKSPVGALNLGIAAARGRALALMIDGAHVLTPGVLRYGMAGLELYGPAIVATQQWYVGPGQQPESIANGFDSAAEDRLFEQIGWPSRGYDLFDIGHLIGDRDWFDPMAESNCLFVPRQLVEQCGGFDESFAVAGGGFANLEIYERFASSPGLTLTTILGAGSFHQTHGGTTTNVTDDRRRRARIGTYRREYAEIRGKAFRLPKQPSHYVGHLSQAAIRTRARHRVSPALWRGGAEADVDGVPAAPIQLPDDLGSAYTEAYWRSLGWKDTRWLGRRVGVPASDLLIYQDLIVRLRPDWIVATHGGDPSLASFLNSICELAGIGQVLSVGPELDADRGAPCRGVHSVAGVASAPETVSRAHGVMGETTNALVLLGSRSPAAQTRAEFDAYSPLVPQGGYVVVEFTVIGGHPVWPGFGPGPAEAVSQILAEHLDYSPDLEVERLGPTFNRRGYLRRSSR